MQHRTEGDEIFRTTDDPQCTKQSDSFLFGLHQEVTVWKKIMNSEPIAGKGFQNISKQLFAIFFYPDLEIRNFILYLCGSSLRILIKKGWG